jgi:hypothetical protein
MCNCLCGTPVYADDILGCHIRGSKYVIIFHEFQDYTIFEIPCA